MKRLLHLFVLPFLIFSCELVIDIDNPDFKSSLVLNSVLSNDSTIRAFVSQDYYILDNELDQYGNSGIPGAEVMIFEDGQLIGTANENILTSEFEEDYRGLYELDYTPSPGKSYRIEVRKEGFNDISGTDRLPDFTQINLSYGTIDTTSSQFGERLYAMDVSIQDLPGDSYYELFPVLHTYEPVFIDDEVQGFRPVTYPFFFNTENIIVPEYQYDRVLFTDDLFKDRSYTFTFTFQLDYLNYLKEEFGLTENSYVVMEVRKCSEAYYNYYNSSALQRWTSGDFLAEPAPIYSNIENGFGFVGSYVASADTLLVF